MAIWRAAAAVLATCSFAPSLLAAAASGDDPTPKEWPPVFHAVLAKLSQDRSAASTRTDLYYDWPGGRNLHINQVPGKPDFYDNEFQNGSTYYYNRGRGGSCKVIDMGVGLLPPNWLQGANYRGMETVTSRTGGKDRLCHVWDKGDAMGNATGPFIVYYEDSETGRPFHWRFFSGMEFEVVQWIPGGVASESTWQLPASCLEGPPQQGAAALHVNPFRSKAQTLSRSTPAGNKTDDVCKGQRCDTAACPCGCECGTKDDAGLCYVPESTHAVRDAVATFSRAIVV